MSPVEQFYHELAPEIDAGKTKRGRKATNMYFTALTQKAILAYNKETDQILRNRIYKEHIDYAFNKLVENIFHTFKFTYFDVPYEDIKCEVVAFLYEKINRYKEENGKAFSYFSRIVKNYLIIQNNANYTKMKRKTDTTVIDDSRNVMLELTTTTHRDILREFTDLWVDWYDTNINRLYANARDIAICEAIIQIFRIRDNIENFNKKSIYILIREHTGLKTQNITRVLKILESDFEEMFDTYQNTGRLYLERIS